MNLASVWKLPVLFLLENNLYGMGTRVDRTYAGGHDVYKASEHYAMEAGVVDGMDVLAVRDSVTDAVDYIRQGNGPFLLEAKTYRFQGHSMADPGEYRDKEEEAEWLTKDPISNMRRQMLEEDLLSEKEIQALESEVDQVLDEAVRFADESPFPEPEALFENVYVE
jgi:pyruvate dehydrogenase E1 component alpha subunit